LCLSGLLAYMAFLWSRFGDHLITIKVQASWGKKPQNPLITFETAWKEAGEGLKQILDRASLFFGQTIQPSIAAAGTISFALFVLSCLLLTAGVPLTGPHYSYQPL
jgi:hypothetical protein